MVAFFKFFIIFFKTINIFFKFLQDFGVFAASGLRRPETAVTDEYQRTIGAFFALYWLARIGLDGEDGFCFGVDPEWQPLKSLKKERNGVNPRNRLNTLNSWS